MELLGYGPGWLVQQGGAEQQVLALCRQGTINHVEVGLQSGVGHEPIGFIQNQVADAVE